MAGRLGNKKVTVQNLKVLKVDIDKNILLVKGAVPGHKGSIISIFDSVKKKQDIKTSINENPKSVEEQKNIQEPQNVENKDNPSQPNQDEAKNQNVNKSLESSLGETEKVKKNDDNENKSSSNEDKDND